MFVNLDANGFGKLAYSLQKVVRVRQQLVLVGERSLQVADFGALLLNLVGQQLDLQRHRFLVRLEPPQPLVRILALLGDEIEG